MRAERRKAVQKSQLESYCFDPFTGGAACLQFSNFVLPYGSIKPAIIPLKAVKAAEFTDGFDCCPNLCRRRCLIKKFELQAASAARF